MSSRRSIGLLLICLVVIGSTAPAAAQKVQVQLESSEAYAGLPFVVALVAEGFEEEPAPEPPELAIEGCTVTYLGLRPDVSQGVRIITGGDPSGARYDSSIAGASRPPRRASTRFPP